MALTANINRDPKRNPEPYKAQDFLPHVELAGEDEPALTDAAAQLRAAFGLPAKAARA